jgi:DNA-binding transcriptional regulator YhcF (GntR family)
MIRIDATAPQPVFEQLRQQISAQVESGELRPGDKLPTVRALAAELGLAPNTVARAFRDLEAAGVVDTRGRAGTFVSGDHRGRAAGQAAADYVGKVRALGLSDAEAIELVTRALH